MDGLGRESDNSFITDFPDSNRFHRLLLFDYASALNEPGRCFWYGTPVGVRRSVSVRVLLSAFVRDHAVDPPRDSSVGRALHSMAILRISLRNSVRIRSAKNNATILSDATKPHHKPAARNGV